MYKYCSNLNKYQRFKTRSVSIGEIPIGYKYPIRIQSMTTTNTLNISATVEQSIRIIEAGSDAKRWFEKEGRELEIKKSLLENEYQNRKQDLEMSFQNIKESKNNKLYQLEAELIQKEKQQLKLESAIALSV